MKAGKFGEALAKTRNKGLFAIIVLAPMLVIPIHIASAQAPDLEKIVFVDYVGPAHLGPAGDACGDGSKRSTTLYGGIKWKSFPVPVFIDATNSGLGSAAADAVRNALNTWDSQGHPATQFFTETVDQNAAKIKISWEFIDGTGNVLAQAGLIFNTKTKAIVSASIVFDSGDVWSITAENCGSMGTSFDVENVAAHEIGHTIGLGHVDDNKLTMYRFASPGETLKRSLGIGDQRGLERLYG
jgi:predicted Zn-dependent protease